jgi:cysteine desulfurase
VINLIYLDNSAGTRVYPEVIETITDVLQNHWGNASADYSFGNDARGIIDDVTEQVADDLNCKPEEIIWTSGACEANSLAIKGVLGVNPHMHFYTTHLEHTSITELVKSIHHPWFFLRNNKQGFIDLYQLDEMLENISYNNNCKMLVSVSAANSEIGTIQDINLISNVVHKYDGLLHVDATQMFPWQSIDVKELGIDLMSVSGQKMHAPKGIGFLYVRDSIKLKPMIYGSQQAGRRAGTHPTHLIAAFGKALEITRKNNAYNKVKSLRNQLLDQLSIIPGVRLNGPNPDENRLCNNINLTIDRVKAETLVTMCDLLDLIVAKGSACKSYEPKPSETLLAIGLAPEQALNTIRISLDEFNTEQEITAAADIITKLVARIREENS